MSFIKKKEWRSHATTTQVKDMIKIYARIWNNIWEYYFSKKKRSHIRLNNVDLQPQQKGCGSGRGRGRPYMIIITLYDHHICYSYMIILYYHHIWSSCMIIIYDHRTYKKIKIKSNRCFAARTKWNTINIENDIIWACLLWIKYYIFGVITVCNVLTTQSSALELFLFQRVGVKSSAISQN